MRSRVRAGEGYGGRFTGGPLLEALQPLLKLQAQPVRPPPKVEARRRGKGRGEQRPRPPGRGGGRPGAAQRGARGARTVRRQRTVRRRTR